MSEFTHSSLPVQGPALPEGFDIYNPDQATVESLRNGVLQILAEQGIDTQNVLLAGYNPTFGKDSNGEFAVDNERHQYFFGTTESLGPPRAEDDEETAEERWVVNPLRYSTTPGAVLGVYDATQLTPHLDPEQVDEEFGTYVAVGTQQEMDAGRLMEITFQQNPQNS